MTYEDFEAIASGEKDYLVTVTLIAVENNTIQFMTILGKGETIYITKDML